MRKAIRDSKDAVVPLTVELLDQLYRAGWRFVQVKGITADLHYEHIEPHHFVLIPMKHLPKDQVDKDVYEPIDSELLRSWAVEKDAKASVFVVGGHTAKG
jgi:hypothetical protein